MPSPITSLLLAAAAAPSSGASFFVQTIPLVLDVASSTF